MNAEKHTYWRGKYRHIRYEIMTFPVMDSVGWTAYILTNSKQVRLAYQSKSIGQSMIMQSFEGEPILTELNRSVPGGVTLFDVTLHPGDDTEYYKVGWDYQHLWNDGKTYNAESIYADVTAVIDALWTIAPDMKVWCSTAGGWHSLKDGITTIDGAFISKEGVEWRVANNYKPLEVIGKPE